MALSIWTERLGDYFPDNNELKIKAEDAKRLNNGHLPRPGFEALVALDGQHWWLTQRYQHAKTVYTIRDAGRWRLENGRAVLGGTPTKEK